MGRRILLGGERGRGSCEGRDAAGGAEAMRRWIHKERVETHGMSEGSHVHRTDGRSNTTKTNRNDYVAAGPTGPELGFSPCQVYTTSQSPRIVAKKGHP